MTKTYDANGNLIKRTVRHGAFLVTQVWQVEDERWWNIRIQPLTRGGVR